MALFDLDPAALPGYVPDLAEPDDFDDFWSRTLAEARGHDLALTATPPPSTVYAAHNEYGAAAGRTAGTAIDVYGFNEHEGGGGHRFPRQLAWLAPLTGQPGMPSPSDSPASGSVVGA